MVSIRSFRSTLIALALMLLVCVPPLAQAAPLTAPAADGVLTGCTGEYFNNVSLSGAPAVVRNDPTLNFFWGENVSPAPGIGVNNYSVRWTCSVNAATAGNYSFNIVTDDGMNVLVDNNLVLWAWYDQGPSAYAATVNLNAGAHTVRVEYYNRWNAGTAQVSSSLIGGGSTGSWKGDYFNNDALAGSPTLTRYDSAINFDWGLGSPDPSIPVDHFSVRWTGTPYFAAGTWQFTTTTDDGVRLWIDNAIVIDQWRTQPATSYTANVTLAAGNHTVVMEYFESVMNAVAKLSYTTGFVPPPLLPTPTPVPPLPGPTSAWYGQYYNNMTLSGSPVATRYDPVLNFNWGETVIPAPGVPHEYFSAKWDSTQNLAYAGNYSVVATSDDGVRVWADGNLVIDGWFDHGPTTFTAQVYFAAGAHTFHVEYYNRTLGAMINVQVYSGAVPPPPAPVSEAMVDDRGAGWQAGGGLPWGEVPYGIGYHAYWAFSNTYSASGYNWARWYPTLTAPGYYEAFAYIPHGIASTLNARYWVYHNGRYDLAARAQGFYADQWLSLGTYYFSAQGGEFVSLATVTYECFSCRTVAFDAVKFVPR